MEVKFIKSKFLVVMMLLILLVSISTIAASDLEDVTASSNDENLTVQASSTETVIEQTDNDYTNTESVSGSDEVLSASSDEEILGAGTTTDLRRDINNAAGSTITLTKDYELTSSIISINKNDLVIDGNGHYIDGMNKYYAFSIGDKYNLTFKNIHFKNLKGNYGAAFLFQGGNFKYWDIVIDNCTFENCNALSGGSITVASSSWNITITNCTFYNNKVSAKGGAIYFSTSNPSNVNIYDSRFINCSTTSNGTQSNGGGAIFINNNVVGYVENCVFENNSAGLTFSEGGAIRYSSTIKILNSNFTSNIAWDGGAVCSGGTTSATIDSCEFINNTAARWGGALQTRNANVYNSKFINNSAVYLSFSKVDNPCGGAIMTYGQPIYISNSEFIDNYCVKGGAIFFENRMGAPTIVSCNFTNNTSNYGGAVYSEYAGTIKISDSNFNKNSAVYKGGALYFDSKYPGDVIITTSEFKNNHALDGGAIYDGGNSLDISYSKFINNTANATAGAVLSRVLTVEQVDFTENSAVTYGGAIYATSSLSTLESNFIKNHADVGGAIQVASISASFTVFKDNYARIAGAMNVEGTTGTNIISDSDFENNIANEDAGAIYWNAADGTLTRNNFISNYAGNDAGAIFWKKGKGTIARSVFSNNKAMDDGGAIYWDASEGSLSSSTFENNHAKEKGGSIYWSGDSGSLSTTTFKNNTIDTKGASVYWYGKNGLISSSTFYGKDKLAQIYWHGTDGSVSQNTFNGDRSVYICQHGSLTLEKNTQINDNYENYSIYNAGNASFKNNDFTNAIHNHGLILTNTSVVVLDNETIVTDAKYYDVYTAVVDDNGNFIKLENDLINTFEGTPYTATFNNTHYVFKTPYLELGRHPVSASGNFAGLTLNTLKSGVLMYMILNINVTVINNGEKVIINTTVVNTTENGTIDLVINGDKIENITLTNGSAIYVLYNVAPDTYIIDAFYDVFNQTIDSEVSYKITLRAAIINIIANNITAGSNTTIIVNLTKGANGTVYIFVNNKMYTKTLSNSSTNVTLTNVAGGNYTVFAIYNGDTYYDASQNSTQFSANKVKPVFAITADDRLVGQAATITITAPDDVTGKIYLYIDNKEYTFVKSLTVSNLTGGNHTVRVSYAGDNKYLAGENSTTFKINKKDIVMTVTPHDIHVGDNEIITINTPSDAKGLILLNINGNNYYVYANETSKVISGLGYGSYNLTATYIEDNIYNEKTVKSSFKVDYVSIDPKITYTVDDNLNAIINATIPSDVTGDMIIEINGVKYTAYNLKGITSVTVLNLTGDSYPAKFYLINDSKYGNVTKDFTVNVNKFDVHIHIDAPTIHVGDNATITVKVVDDAEGNVTITINNKNYTENVTGGKAVFTVSGLPYGEYPIIAVYNGDRKYSSDEEHYILNVHKVDPSPYSYISVNQIFVGENATINITMPDDAYGKVNLTIQGKIYEVNITNGRGQINISGLKYGVPVPIYAQYYGNEKYLPCESEYTAFAVHRITNYDVEITDQTNDTGANITVKIPSDANGPGNITINNKTYQVTFVNGLANISVGDLKPGENYTVYAYFAGDDKYAANDAYKTLNSSKTLDYIFEVTAKDIVVGETAYLTIYLPNATNGTDYITVKVPTQPPITLPVDLDENGIMLYPVNNLPAGSYLISVTYNGNEKYDARSRYGNLSVSKINKFAPQIDVNTPYVGQNLTFNITLPADAGGNVTVTVSINNTLYNATVKNGTAYVVVPGLPEGKYNATVYYSGDDKYNNRTQMVNVEVLKIMDFLFDVDVSDIYVGQNETVYITLPDDINGTVKITIDGTSFINKTVEMIKGKGTFNATGLSQGTYKVTVTLNDDRAYSDENVIRTFKVLTIGDYTFNLHDVDEVNVRDNLTIIVDLPDDATNNVTLNIFGKTVNASVTGGKATFKVPTTSEGTFQFTVSYEENGKYDLKTLSGFAVVSKVNVNLNPEYKGTVNVDENVTFKVQLPSDATGNITIVTRGITFTEKLVNGSANITVGNYSLSSAYSPTVTYTGDDKYNPAAVVVTINVIKVNDYEIKVEVEDIDYKENEVVNITLPSDATDDVLISGNFSDIVYSVSINKGNVSFTIKDLLPGTYNITVRYQGYNKYEDKNVTKTFTVRKITPEITIDYVNNDTIVVNLPIGNGVVNITVGSDNYPDVEVVNGIATLDVSGYLPGTYTVNATFAGDEKYLSNKTGMDITVPRIEDYTIVIEAGDITVGEKATIKITLPEHAVGSTVNITIDNGEVIVVPVTARIAIYNATGLKVGKHNVTAYYAGQYYALKTNTASFNVNKIKTVIQDTVSGNSTNVVINVTLNDDIKGGNVTITVDGVPYTFTNITSNKVDLTVKTLPKEHDIIIRYSGDENHTDAVKTDYIITTKVSDYDLIVETQSIITVLDSNVVNITLPNGVNGDVAITINGISYGHVKVNSTTGKASLTLPQLLSGNYTVVATFSNTYYQEKSNSTKFTVVKLNTTVKVNVTNITRDSEEIINITLNESTNGQALVDINGLKYYVDIVDGAGTLTLSNLNADNYTVSVTYLGDNHYNANSTTSKFTVSKVPVEIIISGGNSFVVDQEVNFTIEVSRDITDLITVNIGNKNYTVVLYHGKANLTVTRLNIGEYNATAIYDGDDYYLPANDTMKFNVTAKKPSAVSVNVSSIIVGNNVTVYVNVTEGATGTVSIVVGGEARNVLISGGKANYTFENLTAGVYKVTAYYRGDVNYLISNATANFTVYKKKSTISLNVSNSHVGDLDVVNLTVTKGATGHVLITVGGMHVYVDLDGNDNNMTVTLTEFEIGEYNITAFYVGDDNYYNSTTKASFNVTKRTTSINITSSNITYGQVEEFIITTSANITEVVTIEINKVNYTSFIEHGKGNFTVHGLKVGDYNVVVYFPGNTQYDSASNYTNFTVFGQKASAVTINVSNITVDDNLTVYVNVTKGATGTVRLVIGGNIYDVNLTDSKGNTTISGLSARDYTISAYYLGDEYYLVSNSSDRFTVFKHASSISANVTNSTVGSVEYINVTVPNDAQGTVLISINGSHYYGDIENGVAKFNVTGLYVGEHIAYITYSGDERYNRSSIEVKVNVSKLQTSINITSSNITYGQIEVFNITTSANLTEVVMIEIDGTNYTSFIENGKGIFSISGLNIKDYKVYVYFPENTQYDAVSNFTEFTVKGKIKSSINVKVANITVGGNITVYVNATEGINDTVYVTIAGVAYTKTLVNGKVNFTVANLTARDYVISAFFMGNTYYEPSNTTSTFTVNKKKSTIELNVSNIFVGDTEFINVTVDKGATGYVLINIAGIHIYADIDSEGIARAEVHDLSIENYKVSATYLGDSNYTGNSTEKSFNVTKHKTTIVITTSNITVGQTVKFNITTSANFTEVVTIRIGNNNYTTFVENGTGTFSVPNLGVDDYTAYVYFPGNSKYDAVENQTNFTVSPKKVSAVTIKVENIVVGDNLTVYLNVTDKTTGRITLTIAGNTYTAVLNNSKANFTIENLTARNYHITAHYLGDEYYLESNASAEFVVNKKVAALNVTVANITVDQAAVLNITITNGTSGVVLIDINGTDYFADIKNGSAQLTVKNIAVGEYKVIVKYNGDSYYNATENSTWFKVSKLPSQIGLAVVSATPIAQGNDVLIKVTGPSDVTGVATVTVTTDGVGTDYTVYINNGEGSLIISKPNVGKYTVVANYAENYKYSANVSNAGEFEVYANGTSLDVKSHNINVGDNETIIVTIAGNHTGNVTVSIDGNNIVRNISLKYNSTSNSSVATLVLENAFAAGIHQVEATYVTNESDKIITHKGSSLFIVSKIKSTIVINPISNIAVGQNVTITLNLSPADASGNVTVYVNGEKYVLKVDNLTLTIPNLGATTYLVQARYDGDNKYEFSEDDESFTVFKNNVSVKLNVSDITIAQTEQINVTLPDDASGYVLINVNGTHYYATIRNGVASVNISDLTPGKYDVNVTFIGDNKYYANSTVSSFNVSKLKTDIKINGSDIFIGQDEIFNITTSEKLTVVVIVEIDGKNYTSFIENGQGSLRVSNLNTVKLYTATVYFNGNTHYEAIKNHTTFNVKGKQKSSINVTVADITVGENITVYVNATETINDTIYVTIAGVAYTDTLVNGRASFQVANLTARNYTVSVFFMGNDYFEASNSSSTFKVNKMNATISLNVSDIRIGQIEVINVTLPENATGNVLISIGSIHVYAEIVNGVATANITNLDVGKHNVTVVYLGDNKYNGNSTKGSFNVSKLSTTISIEGSNITVGQDEILTFTTSANFTEVVTIKIGDNNYTAFVKGGKGNFTVKGLAKGNYTAYIYFPGNTQYGDVSDSTNFTVSAKSSTSLTVTVENITVGQNATVQVTVSGAQTGNVTLAIAGNPQTLPVVDGKVNFTVSGLTARNYHITVFYLENEYYLASNATADFVVNKINATISLNVANITMADVEMINVTLPSGATGYVLININGTHYYADINEGIAQVNVSDLIEGKYNVTVTYLGDSRYNGNSTNASFTVSKLKTTIVIKGSNITSGQAELLNITTSANITEVIIIKIGSYNYTTFVENGKGSITIYNLASDNYTVYAYFGGNAQYSEVENHTNFTVSAKKASAVDVDVRDITVGQNATITVNITKGATGNVTIVIAGEEHSKEVDADGKAVFTIENLIARDYHVTAYYRGDDYYVAGEGSDDFTVNKKSTAISANVTNSTVGNVEYINVTVDRNASGTVLLTVDGAHYYGEIENGVAKFNVTGLKEGIYTANITYLGDNNFDKSVGQVKINITKLATSITISSQNITEGQVEVLTFATSANFTEVVTIKIGDKNYTAFVENGKGNFTVYGLTANPYTAYICFPGNTQYRSAQNSTNFTVSAKKVSQITVTAVNITVGQNATITVNVTKGATGIVTIVLAGREYSKEVDTDGKAVFTIENLTARDYHVSALYKGDTYYGECTGETDFKVNKKNTPISASVTNTTVGSVEYINVTVDKDANGTVLLTVDNAHYYGEVIDGVAKFNVTGLLVGNYTAVIRYLADDKFNENTTQVNITISKKSTLINITGQNITEGQIEKLIIQTSQNITSQINVEIGDHNYTTYISEGKGELNISGLAADEYSVTVYYPGNNEYDAITNVTSFKVDAKKLSEITVSVDNITVGDNAIIEVNVTEGATGNVTLIIRGNEYSEVIDSNGKATFTVPDLIARDYEITVRYDGDTYYSKSSAKANFTVKKIPSEIDVDVSDIVVGNTEKITVNVTEGATGRVLIYINGTTHDHYKELTGSSATFDIKGLEPGTYNVTVTYEGDNKYNMSVTSKTFIVHPEIKVTPGTNDGNSTPLTVKVSDDPTASGNVTIIIDGEKYNATVVNGTATVNVNATPGKQNVTVIYTPDDGKAPTEQNKTVDIPKVTNYDVSVDAEDIKEGENATIKVNLPSDATGNATIRVGNKTIPAKVENGVATVNVSDLPVGSHDITVEYEGDSKYAPTTYKSNINVKVNIPTIEAIDLVRGWNSPFDYEAVFLNQFGEVLANTEVTFIVGGKTYTVSTESHGIAKLNTSKLDIGEYNVIAINPVTGEQVTKNLKIVPRLIENKDITMDFVDGTYYTVLVIGDDGKPVGQGEIIDIYVNTIHYVSKTDADGYARLKINLNPNNYKVIAEYKTYQVHNKLKVKQTLKLVKKTVKVKKTAKKLVIKAKLKWSNGKPIKGKKLVLKFKGKKYTAKTNAKGIAKFTIKKKVVKKLKKGKKYSYSVSYITNIVKGKVSVKK